MGGLKDMWGLDDPNVGVAGDCEQGRKFIAAFKASLANVNRSLQYTAAHAEKKKHEPLAASRDALLKRFRSTLSKIDPADAAKAQRGIKDTLADIAKLEADAAALKQEAEAAEQAWESKAAAFETAYQQINELADWGDASAEQLQLDASTTQSLADERQYRDAVSGCDDLLAELKPVYAAYQEQKAAREQYERELALLEPKFAEATQSSFASLVERQQALDRLHTAMTASADAKDYVKAVATLGELSKGTDECIAARDELEGKRKAYESARAALEPRFPASDQGGGTALMTEQEAISTTIAEMTTAAEAEDYDTASRLLGELEPRLTALETLIEQRDAYTERLAEIQPKLPTTSEPGSGHIAEAQDAITALTTDSEQAAADGDYTTAVQKLDELEPRLDELAAIVEARGRFEAKFADIQPRIPTTDEAGNGRLATVQTEIATLAGQIQSAADETDYESAMPYLDELEPKLTEFEQLRELRDRYEDAWATLQPKLPTSSQQGSPDEAALEQQLSELRAKVDKAAADGDYEGALVDIEALEARLDEMIAAHEAYEKQKADYETRHGALKLSLEMALDNCPAVKELEQAQDEVKAKKAEAEAAAASGDYESALVGLDALDLALKAYQDELRKKPRECDWVLATAIELNAQIQIKYLQASNKIASAAQAYDDALGEHKAALKKVRDAQQLANSILAGIFFAGLGGAVGGAVGTAVKQGLGKEFADLAQGGAVIDATKDVAKFTTRMIQNFGGKPGDPTKGLPGVGGSGVELARKVGQAVNTQGAALLEEVVKLARLVKENAAQCKEGPVRLEGDPTEALGSDPFLKALGTIANADKKSFARLLWDQWIQAHAYSIEMICSKAGCSARVEDNVEDGWAWWEDLTEMIESQAGEDFGLRARLDAARADVARQVAERNAHRFGL